MPMQSREFVRQVNLAEREPAEANAARRKTIVGSQRWPDPGSRGGCVGGRTFQAPVEEAAAGPGCPYARRAACRMRWRGGLSHRRAARATVIAGPHGLSAGLSVENRAAESQGRFRLGSVARWAGAAGKV